jgi:hypothetical protein
MIEDVFSRPETGETPVVIIESLHTVTEIHGFWSPQ